MVKSISKVIVEVFIVGPQMMHLFIIIRIRVRNDRKCPSVLALHVVKIYY